jgi:cation:H+ antiporter
LIHPISYNTSMNFDMHVMLASTMLLILFMFTFKQHKLDRREATLFLLIYLAYTIYLIIQG